MCDRLSLRSTCAYAQSDQSLCSSLEYSMSVKLLTEHLLAVLSLIGECTGSYKSTLVKMPHCRKSHVMAHMFCSVLYSGGGGGSVDLGNSCANDGECTSGNGGSGSKCGTTSNNCECDASRNYVASASTCKLGKLPQTRALPGFSNIYEH